MNPAFDHTTRQWRVGRKVGRTIYAVVNLADPDRDPLIGVMDTPELAADAVYAHNHQLDVRESTVPQ